MKSIKQVWQCERGNIKTDKEYSRRATETEIKIVIWDLNETNKQERVTRQCKIRPAGGIVRSVVIYNLADYSHTLPFMSYLLCLALCLQTISTLNLF